LCHAPGEGGSIEGDAAGLVREPADEDELSHVVERRELVEDGPVFGEEIELGQSRHRDRGSLDDLKGEGRREHALQLHVPNPGGAKQLPLRLVEIEGEDVVAP
jgi:hypothetical protein